MTVNLEQQLTNDGLSCIGKCEHCGFVMTAKLVDYDIVNKNGVIVVKDAVMESVSPLPVKGKCPFCGEELVEG